LKIIVYPDGKPASAIAAMIDVDQTCWRQLTGSRLCAAEHTLQAAWIFYFPWSSRRGSDHFGL